MKQTEEEFFKELLSKSKLQMPLPDFEENIMMQIHKEKVHQQVLSRDIRLSCVFTTIMVILGIFISLMVPQLQHFYPAILPQSVKIIFELLFVVFVLLQIDTLIKYVLRNKNQLKNQLREA